MSDTLTVTVTDAYPATTTYEYGFSADATCDATDTYGNAFTSGTAVTIASDTNTGDYVCVSATDLAGNTTYVASANPLNVDTTAPTTAIGAPDSGGTVFGSGNPGPAAAAFSGTGEDGDTVVVDDGTGNTCTATVAGGVWSCSVPITADGTLTYTATETDAAGNTDTDTVSLDVYLDTDGDGHPDAVETAAGSDPNSDTSLPTDTDGDGVPDTWEATYGSPSSDENDSTDVGADSDGDGHPDYVELAAGTDPDDSGSTPTDTDGDLIPDVVELMQGTSETDATDYLDGDGDGVPSYIEGQDGTNSNDVTDYTDSDGGGAADYIEVTALVNAGVAATNASSAADDTQDTDGDGYPDYIEIIAGTDPNLNTSVPTDTDGDGVPDVIETQQGTSATDSSSYQDTDGDGHPDFVEMLAGSDGGDDAVVPVDTDGDGVPDVIEAIQGTSPTDITDNLDTDGDGHPDYLEIISGSSATVATSVPSDTDGDGVPDAVEVMQGSDPADNTSVPTDTDGDGHPNYVEMAANSDSTLAASLPTDTDGDGVPDVVETMQGTSVTSATSYLDNDGDLVPAYVEGQDGTSDTTATAFADADGAGTPDYVETILFVTAGLTAGDVALASDDARDTDADGVSDYAELLAGTDPNGSTATIVYGSGGGGGGGGDNSNTKTVKATSVGKTSVILNGKITDEDDWKVWFILSATDVTPLCSDDETIVSVSGTKNEGDTFKIAVTDLLPNTKYYYRACGDNGDDSKGSILTFTTGDIVVPTPTVPTPTTPTNNNSATSVCSPYLKENIKLGGANNPVEVQKLETFLNEHEGESLVVDGVYGQADFEAVKRFQSKYASAVLTVWGLNNPTGFVYITTRNKINSFKCNKALSCPVFTEFNRIDENNFSNEVQLTKVFMTELGFYNGIINQSYDAGIEAAIDKFQETFSATMLTPWGLTQGTGYKYKTTNKYLNELVGCPSGVLNLENGAVVNY